MASPEVLTMAGWHWPEALGLGTLLHIMLFGAVALHCLIHPRDARSTILWLFATWSLPLVGALAYAAFGVSRVPRKVWRKQHSDRKLESEVAARQRVSQPLAYWHSLRTSFARQPRLAPAFNSVLDRITPDHPLLDGNTIDMLLDGTETYPAILESVRAAKHHIHALYYIIGKDAIAKEFLDACAERARAGVKVRILFDEFGSAAARLSNFFKSYRKVPNMRITGYSQVNLMKRRIQINLRNHRKIVVVDGMTAFTGGINMHAGHVAREGRHAIRDYHFRVQGPLVNEIQYTFLRDWYYMTEEDPDELLGEAYFGQARAAGNIEARIVNSGPSETEHSLDDLLFNALTEARQEILAVTPYMILTEPLMAAFRNAAMRGVRVRLVVPGNNNHISVKYASRSQYAALMAAGVRVFERFGPLLHAKAMVIDGALSLIGSANLDIRSLRLNYETTIVSYDSVLASRLIREMLVDLAASREIKLNAWSQRKRRHRILENLFALASPIL